MPAVSGSSQWQQSVATIRTMASIPVCANCHNGQDVDVEVASVLSARPEPNLTGDWAYGNGLHAGRMEDGLNVRGCVDACVRVRMRACMHWCMCLHGMPGHDAEG